MKKNIYLLALGILIFSSPVVADVLIMANGDHLTGEVVKKSADTLTFKTSYGEPFLIDWNKVKSLVSDKPMKVLSEDDRSVTETSLIDENSPYYFDKSRARKYTINPEGWRLGQGTKFSGRINFGLKIDKGNTDKDELDTDVFLEARNLKNRYTLTGNLEKDESEGAKTSENYSVTTDYDRFINNNLFISTIIGYEKDEFADLNRRLKYGTAVGYQIHDDTKKNLSVEVGPVWVDEEFTAGEESQFWAAGWKINYEHFIITDTLQFYHRQDGTLDLEDTDKVLFDARFGLRAPIYGGITGSTEFVVDYDSEPAAGADDTDTQFAIKFGYQW